MEKNYPYDINIEIFIKHQRLMIEDIKTLNELEIDLYNYIDFNINKTIKNINFSNIRIKELPKSFWQMKINGNLDLSHNKIKELPEDLIYIIIGGNLNLSHNRIKELPEDLIYIKNRRSFKFIS